MPPGNDKPRRGRPRREAAPPPERIHKTLANAGLGSRRQIEAWIAAGRITLNGRTARPGDKAGLDDRISLDGSPVRLKRKLPARTRVIACYKPAGEICSRSDPEGRKTVFERLPPLKKGRWVNIGRLDINTMGLLLFTNNGELANRLMHPSGGTEREYAVRVLGRASAAQLAALKTGVQLEDGLAAFTAVEDAGGDGSNHWYRVVLTEGRKHEVRRLWESQGLKVSRLIRVRYGSYSLPTYRRTGSCWELTEADIERLQNPVIQSQKKLKAPKAAPKKDKIPPRKKHRTGKVRG